MQEIEDEKTTLDTDNLLTRDFNRYGADNDDPSVNQINPSDSVVCVQGKTLFWQRFRALAFIRIMKLRRNISSIVTQLVIPVIILVVGLVLAKTLSQGSNTSTQESARSLTAALYSQMPSIPSQYFPYSTTPRLLIRDQVSKW